jgi:hypothetical protein
LVYLVLVGLCAIFSIGREFWVIAVEILTVLIVAWFSGKMDILAYIDRKRTGTWDRWAELHFVDIAQPHDDKPLYDRLRGIYVDIRNLRDYRKLSVFEKWHLWEDFVIHYYQPPYGWRAIGFVLEIIQDVCILCLLYILFIYPR